MARLPDTDFLANYEIISARLEGFNRAGDPINMHMPSGRVTSDVQQYVQRLRNGKPLTLSFIKARVAGTTSPVYDLPPITLKVVE